MYKSMYIPILKEKNNFIIEKLNNILMPYVYEKMTTIYNDCTSYIKKTRVP